MTRLKGPIEIHGSAPCGCTVEIQARGGKVLGVTSTGSSGQYRLTDVVLPPGEHELLAKVTRSDGSRVATATLPLTIEAEVSPEEQQRVQQLYERFVLALLSDEEFDTSIGYDILAVAGKSMDDFEADFDAMLALSEQLRRQSDACRRRLEEAGHDCDY